jgi:acyl-ACP thioesterase
LYSPGVSGILGVIDVREENFVVKTNECGADGRIRIASLMQYLQEAAALHAEQLGFGFEKLGALDGYWVLSNIRVEIAPAPCWGDGPAWNEQVAVQTWPSGYSRSVATREFIGRDRNGGEIFRAGSEWMVINKRTNRLKNLFRLDLGLPKTGRKALPNELSRLELQEDYRPVERVRVPYSSIDLNGHVNNTEYVRWGVDALRHAFRLEGDIRSLQATYLSEVFEDDEVEIAVSSDGNGKFCVLGSKPGDGRAVYLMEIVC